MLSRSDFNEPEAMSGLSWNPNFRLYPLKGAPFQGSWLGYRFGRAWVQEIRTNQDCVAFFRTPVDRTSIFFSPANTTLLGSNGSEHVIAGLEEEAGNSAGFHCFKAPSSWAELSFPQDIRQNPDSLDQGATFLPTEAEADATLRLLHQLALTEAGLGGDPASPRSIQSWESAFLLTGMQCLTNARRVDDTAQRRREHVLSRFAQFLEENPGELIHLTDLCSAIGANARTLRLYCEQSLGMGPTRFMRLRRLHQARHALGVAAGGTVLQVACDFGFYEAGRFSAEYARTFGEYPSSTIKRARRRSVEESAPSRRRTLTYRASAARPSV